MLGMEKTIELPPFERHNHFLTGEIDGEKAEATIRWILSENRNPSGETLQLYINSEGGSLNDALAIIDIMHRSEIPIITVGLGSVMSAGFLIFASGTKGQRLIGKNSSLMCHQFTHELSGKYHDIKTTFMETERINERMVDVLFHACGMKKNLIRAKLLKPTDVWLSPEDVIKLGIADHIF
jgi:ATP-dependent Clp protease protease subunit